MNRAFSRWLLIAGVVAVSVWVLIPIYLLAASSFSGRLGVNAWPKPLFPAAPTLEVLHFFFRVEGVWKATFISLQVAAMTMVFPSCLALRRAMRWRVMPLRARICTGLSSC
jgi:multiple sugar transport system permease protein